MGTEAVNCTIPRLAGDLRQERAWGDARFQAMVERRSVVLCRSTSRTSALGGRGLTAPVPFRRDFARNRAWGDAGLQVKVEKALGRPVRVRPPGRPRSADAD